MMHAMRLRRRDMKIKKVDSIIVIEENGKIYEILNLITGEIKHDYKETKKE